MQVDTSKKIAIIGGGVAGASMALYLGELGLNVTLFEKKPSLVNGPPFCHLHAGGNLYREISDEQCITLLRQSIEFVHLYPCAIDFRPTVITVPRTDKGNPEDLQGRLEKLKAEYACLIHKDIKNRILGSVEQYYKFFSKEELVELAKKEVVERPVSFEEWMIPVAKNIDLEKIKFPLVMVQEYGLNIFRLSASVSLSLESLSNVHIRTETVVSKIIKNEESFTIDYMQDEQTQQENFDYLINAAGFSSGIIDDMLGLEYERFVEFKAAYVTKWQQDTLWPEVIFHGERGTPNGMAQFTPYPNGYVQLHGMTEDITLFEDGLAKSRKESAQPALHQSFINKIEKGWSEEESHQRTSLAIKHLSKFVPAFENAKIASQPLFGAQQIPGSDASLRAAEVSFDGEHYARCEIVKASSILDMADAITQKLIGLAYIESAAYKSRKFSSNNFTHAEITKYAQKICVERNYPISLANRDNSSIVI